MAASSGSLVRRLAVPLGVSGLLHALIIGLPCLVPAPRQPAARAAGTSPFRFLMSLGVADAPRKPPRPALVGDPWARNDINPTLDENGPELPVKIARLPTSTSPAPGAQGSQPGEGKGSGSAQAGAKRTPGLLKVPGTARRIVYLLDCSSSMGPSGALDTAKQEVLASLRTLPADALFQIIAYNEVAGLLMSGGDLVRAAPAVIDEAERRLTALNASGATNHTRALEKGLLLLPTPDLIFLLTDADDLTPADVRAVTYRNRDRRAAIHVVELTSSTPAGESLLARLAAQNDGSFRRVRPAP